VQVLVQTQALGKAQVRVLAPRQVLDKALVLVQRPVLDTVLVLAPRQVVLGRDRETARKRRPANTRGLSL
jgi:hypothetical protein